MTLALDFGSSSIKAILVNEAKSLSRFFSFNTTFRTPVLSESTLIQTIKLLEDISSEKILDGNKPLAKIYASLGLPVYEPCKTLSSPVVLTAQALTALNMNVMDVGFQFIHFNDHVSAAPVDIESSTSWLPFKIEATELSSYIENKKIYSAIIPMSPRDLFFEQATARARVIDFFKSQRIEKDFTEVYLSGAVFSRAPYLEQVVLMALDSIQPEGVLKIWLDRNQILPVSGLLKLNSIEEYSHLGDDFSPLFLGTTISVPYSCDITIDLNLGDSQSISLKKDELYVFPLKTGEEASVTVICKNGSKKKQTFSAVGGAVGLVLDLRSRPLKLPESSISRHEMLKTWDRSIGASGQIEKI